MPERRRRHRKAAEQSPGAAEEAGQHDRGRAGAGPGEPVPPGEAQGGEYACPMQGPEFSLQYCIPHRCRKTTML